MDGNGTAIKRVLTREQILAAVDLKIEAVEVPEWDSTVYVRNLTGRARDKFEASRYRLKDKSKEVEVIHDNTRAQLLALTLCDEDGKLLFTDADVAALGEKNAAVLDRLFDVARRLSGMRPEDTEDRRKNSPGDQADSSSLS